MQRFSVDVFNRSLVYVCNEQTAITSIDDDYLSPRTNAITIPNVEEEIIAGFFIRLRNEETEFFGLITDVSPGEFETTIQFSSFISIFDETVLFWTLFQGLEAGHTNPIGAVIAYYIRTYYVSTTDTLMKLPIKIYVDPNVTDILQWTLGITRARDNANFAVVNIYQDLIVPALKRYGVSIVVKPDFNARLIDCKITISSKVLNIDGNLDDVTVRTLKYNNRPLGTNKLEVVNNLHPTDTITYYVHPDMSFNTTNANRITPVAFETRMIVPQEDTTASFQEAALEEAYNVFSGAAWDNLIELEVAPDNQNILPMEMEIGQKVTLWYKEATYSSILTGKTIEDHNVVLLFGSERIEYTKRAKR